MSGQCLAQPGCVEGVMYSSQKAEQCLAAIGGQSCSTLLMFPESCLSIIGCLFPKGMSGGAEPPPTDFAGTWNGSSTGSDSTTTWSLRLNSDHSYQLTSTQEYRSDITSTQAGCRATDAFFGSWSAADSTVRFPARLGSRMVEQCADPSQNQAAESLSESQLSALNQSALTAVYDSALLTLTAALAPGAVLRR